MCKRVLVANECIVFMVDKRLLRLEATKEVRKERRLLSKRSMLGNKAGADVTGDLVTRKA